jgi:RNA polymerase-interacting CarD/CdnL/TRCF family regulator
MSKEEMEELLDFLRSKIEMKKRFNTRQAKEILKSNDAEKIAMILKKLAIVRRDPDTNFTYTKKRVFRQGLKRLQEEVALVLGEELEDTRKMLLDILKEQAVISFPLDEEEED